jgi:hypothetical protein
MVAVYELAKLSCEGGSENPGSYVPKDQLSACDLARRRNTWSNDSISRGAYRGANAAASGVGLSQFRDAKQDFWVSVVFYQCGSI